ncbi:DNA internalization-related competence protein ComEC/Rec2 [Guyparkeria halophila]|uniref:DNA internalization-related competence protein ComEC/Rec2 n=1 Tax=Guyparkeria halophila TaxID=47960 RepID=A0ABZ0YY76_9GAMM|nr:DNA internalization-related competence protein ComEC/Rec2 [Guyparkeria halophila]WQH17115.1 DNA internalization-related competence protein ComEC/Rec2 [Guyparkeria halophila]
MDREVMSPGKASASGEVCARSPQRRLAARWLLLAWAGAALLAWFVPWWALVDSGLAAVGSAWWAMLVLGLALLALGAWRQGFSRWALLVIGVAGALHTLVPVAILVDRTPVFADRVDCQLKGKVVGLVDDRVDRRRLTFAVQTARAVDPDDRGAARVCQRLLPGGRLKLSDYTPPPGRVELIPGVRYDLKARIKPLRGHANPGGFDYRRYLFRHQILATGYLRERQPIDLGRASGWAAQVDRWRDAARSRLQETLAAAERRTADGPLSAGAALLHGLALGDRGELSDRQWEWLLASGTNHLLAISGLHVGMVAALAAWLVRVGWGWLAISRGWPAQRLAALAAVLAAWSYALIAGLSIPTLRAALMLTVLLLGVLMQRRWRLLDLWLIAFVLVMGIDPFAPLDMGFWLSFAAVLLIIVMIRGREGLWRPWELLRLQWLLTLGLLPLTWGLFDRVAFASLPANLLAVPLVSMLITPLALLTLFLALISPAVAAWPAWLIDGLGQRLFGVLGWLVAIFPDSNHAPPGPLVLALFALGVLWLGLPRRFPGRVLAIVLLLPALLVGSSRPAPGQFEAVVLDVGQGAAVLLRTAHHDLLYDAGPRHGRFDTGEAIVLPALRALNVSRLDRIVISHDAMDHAGGLASIRQAFPQAAVVGLTEGRFGVTGAGMACRHGSEWSQDGVRFSLLRAPRGSSNDRSCVLHVAGASESLLLTGDIEAAAEQWLLRHARLEADAVLVPHHGSASSSTTAFINATGARRALVSAGFLNRWGHPREAVTARWQAAGATVWRTDRDGALHLERGGVRAERAGQWPFPWRRPAASMHRLAP